MMIVSALASTGPAQMQTPGTLTFNLADSDGRRVHSADYDGIPVFLEVGPTW